MKLVNIPNYPHFTEVNITHKNIIEDINSKFKPYCDFTFSNLFVWQVADYKTKLSMLNGNLVIKAKNIINEELEVSFIGDKKIEETTNILLEDFEKLNLIPEEIIKTLLKKGKKGFKIIEDKDNHDYILSTELISKLEGKPYLNKRKKINRFLRTYPKHKIEIIKPHNKQQLADTIRDIYTRWINSKGENFKPLKLEKKVLEIFAAISENLEVEVWTVKVHDEYRAFATIEYINPQYTVSSFAKYDLDYSDANTYLTYITAKYLKEKKGIKFINHEQDLGLLNLRNEKLSWRPTHLLKKFKIYKK